MSQKKILIPLLTKELELDNSIFFDLKIKTEDNATITRDTTRIEIKPYSNNENEALITLSEGKESQENKEGCKEPEDLDVLLHRSLPFL